MTRSEAQFVVATVQAGGHHDRLAEALAVLNLTLDSFRKFMGEARKVEGRKCGLEISTPTGSGRHR